MPGPLVSDCKCDRDGQGKGRCNLLRAYEVSAVETPRR